MKKLYMFLTLALLWAASVGKVNAQVTITTAPTSSSYWSATSSCIVFGVENTNAFSIYLTDLGNYTPANNSATYTLWYHPTAITGVPPDITTANGWIQVPVSATVSGTSAGITPLFTGMTLLIPATTTYRLCLVASTAGPYYGPSGSSPVLTAGGGVNIHTQASTVSPTYVGYFPGPVSNTPRGFYGSITFIPAGPCVSPPTAGTASATPSTACVGSTISLSLNGNSGGTGQTYQWQSGPSATGPWTNLGPVLNSPLYSTTITGTTWYRSGVTCSANTAYTPAIQVTTNPNLPAGTYTINSALPTAGTNFQTFTAAVAALSCGIAGPVVFNVNATSGPYNEQIVIPSILNASAINTVTFNGNNRVLTFAGTSSNYATLTLNNADHIIIKKLNIQNTATATARALLLTNGAKRNLIDSCKIDVGITATASTTSPLGIGTTSVSSTAAGGSCDSNIISNCEIIGGYYCAVMVGASATLQTYNQFKNNVVRDFYLYGIYMTYNKDAQIEGNEVHRLNRTSVSTFYGIYNSTGNQKMFISKNKIHDPFGAATTSTSAGYFIYNSASSTSGNDNVFSNNIIYKANGNGTHYYLYSSSSAYSKWHFNTVNSDFASTAGISYGIYQTSTPTSKVMTNNIINITRGGSGVKYDIYHVASTYTGFTYNRNNYFSSNAAAFYNGGALTNLASWQTSSGQDANSMAVAPNFVAPATGNLTPTNLAMDNLGTAIAGITTDILGTTRNATTPDAGAFEFNNCNPVTGLAASALTTTGATISWTAVSGSQGYQYAVNTTATPPASGTAHPTTSVPVTGLTSGTVYYAHVRNVCGTASFSPWVTITFTTCTQATTNPTGPITFCAGDSIVYTANAGTSYQWKLGGNNIAGATANTFKAFAAGSYSVTINSPNGCVSTSAASVVTVTAPVANITPSGNVSMCPGSTTALNAPVGAGYTYQWRLNGTPVSGATNILYNAPSAGNYTVTVSSGAGCNTTTATPTSISLYTPPPAAITPPPSTSVCPNSNITLNANTGTGLTYQWYLNTTSLGSAATNASYTGTGAGNYTVKVTSTATTCATTSDPVTITLAPAPPSVASAVNSLTGCDTVLLTGNQGTGYTYQWLQGSISLSGATSIIYQALATGPYSVKVTSPNGCATTSAPVNITVHPSPQSAITYSSPLSFCFGGAVALTVYQSAGYTYQWYENSVSMQDDTTSGYIATTNGSYAVLVTNTFGCQKMSPPVQVIVNPLPTPVVTADGNMLSTTQFADYQWYRNNQPVPGANSQTHTGTANGLYYVAVTDMNGCQNRSNGIFMNATGIGTASINTDDIKLYPNPTRDVFNVSAPVKLTIAIQDLAGRTMMTVTNAQQIDVRNLATGVYMVQMRDMDGTLLKTERLFKVE